MQTWSKLVKHTLKDIKFAENEIAWTKRTVRSKPGKKLKILDPEKAANDVRASLAVSRINH